MRSGAPSWRSCSPLCALGLLSPAARADGDPGSDVLVYQNLFVAADANVSVQQQIQLGNLLTAADKDGFPVRVAVVSQPNDLGAITALWQKPAAYASFLGTELSLAYAQRLLIVMPNGFGFNWQGHSAAAAYRVLDGLHIGAGGAGLATAAQNAVLALAHASGVRLAAPCRQRGGERPGSKARSPSSSRQDRPRRAEHAAGAPSGSQVPLIAGIAVAVVLAGAAGGWFLPAAYGGRPTAESRPTTPRQDPRHLARGRVRGLAVATVVYVSPPSVRARQRGTSRRGADQRADDQPEPRSGAGPVRPGARLHAHRPVRSAGVAEFLPRQGRDPRVQRRRVHHDLPADHRVAGRRQGHARRRRVPGPAGRHRRQPEGDRGRGRAVLLAAARDDLPVAVPHRVAARSCRASGRPTASA